MNGPSTVVLTETNFETLPTSLDDGGGASAEDAALFQKNVFGSGESQPSFANSIIDKFSDVSKDIGIKKAEFETKLEKASRSGDQVDVLEATRAMGDYQLQVLLSTKVASKATAAIDKLTNLQ